MQASTMQANQGKLYKPVPLSTIQPGCSALVVAISATARVTIQKLMAVGVFPGVQIKIIQRYPVYLLQVGQTYLACDYGMVSSIMVSKGRLPACLKKIGQ